MLRACLVGALALGQLGAPPGLPLFTSGPETGSPAVSPEPPESQPVSTSDLACAIAQAEGWSEPGSLTRRLHNPGALVFAGQASARPDPSGYARFPTDEAGWEATRRDLAAKLRLGMDLPMVGREWAQADPVAYLDLLRRILVHPPAWCR